MNELESEWKDLSFSWEPNPEEACVSSGAGEFGIGAWVVILLTGQAALTSGRDLRCCRRSKSEAKSEEIVSKEAPTKRSGALYLSAVRATRPCELSREVKADAGSESSDLFARESGSANSTMNLPGTKSESMSKESGGSKASVRARAELRNNMDLRSIEK